MSGGALTWNTVYATQVNGRTQLNSLILNISMPHVSISPNRVPSAFSCGVSTPNVGKRSPVNELVCDNNGRVTPDICDIGGPPKRGDRLRFFCAFNCAISFSSIRSDGKSNSCCLSANFERERKNHFVMKLFRNKCASTLPPNGRDSKMIFSALN